MVDFSLHLLFPQNTDHVFGYITSLKMPNSHQNLACQRISTKSCLVLFCFVFLIPVVNFILALAKNHGVIILLCHSSANPISSIFNTHEESKHISSFCIYCPKVNINIVSICQVMGIASLLVSRLAYAPYLTIYFQSFILSRIS